MSPRVPKLSPEAPALTPTGPAPASRPPVVVARLPDEDHVSQDVTLRLVKCQEIIDKIDPAKLTDDRRELFSSVQDFVAKAKEAYQAKDMARAQVLAQKASRLADDLAAAVKR